MNLTGGSHSSGGGGAGGGRGFIGFTVPRPNLRAKPVMSLADRAVRRALFGFGGYVRKTARQSIRKRKSVSQPGQPPTSRTGLLRDHIFFHVDQHERSVIIGPAALNQIQHDSAVRPVRGLVPEILEFGGEITIMEERREDAAQDSDWGHLTGPRRKRHAKRFTLEHAGRNAQRKFVEEFPNGGRRRVLLRNRLVTVRPRPYMTPAFEEGLSQLERFFGDDTAGSSRPTAVAA